MKIVFYSNQLSERGTETALIDYAFANRDILKNESILAFPEDRIFDDARYQMLKKEFDVILMKNVQEFNQLLLDRSVDLLYLIVDGKAKDVNSDALAPLARRFSTTITEK